ncbi:MAG TPA: hypothetical protein VIM69_11770 [Opitutaceae bacterium]
MRLFNKKGSGATGDVIQPWHPNFRNTTELPDIKTVRTKFFINAACIVLALGALLYWLYIEYTVRTIDGELKNVNNQIAHDTKGSQEAIAQYKKFKANEAKITELSTFASGQKLLLSDFITNLGQTLPEHVLVTEIQLKEQQIDLRGTIKSSSEAASGISAAYEKQLRDSREFGSRFSSVVLTSLSRDASTGFMNFEIVLKFKK